MPLYSVGLISLTLGLATVAAGQDQPAPGSVEPQWQTVAASSAKTYLANTTDVRTLDDGVALPVAIVSSEGAAGDYSHTVDQYAIRCASGEFRVAAGLAYGPDGSEEDNWTDDAAPWDPIREGSLADAVKDILCEDSSSSSQPYPSIRAFIDGGRR